MNKSIHEFKALDINGNEISFSQYQNKVLLIVNVASKCGFTNQYSALQELYLKYKDQGLEILAFPCNQFGAQEPGNAEEIKNFCSLTYNVTFPIFAKVDVNGDGTHPIYNFLKSSLPGILGSKSIKWNFTKFLIGRDGVPVKRFAPNDKPEELVEDLKKLF